MKKNILFLCCCLLAFGSYHLKAQDLTVISYNELLLEKIRKAAQTIPGKKANELRYIKFAESPRKFSQVVEGGDDIPYIQARTAYQVMFGKEWIMVDAGMDREVHEFFGKGEQQPYFASANDTVQQALKGAKKILITHEHGDHVAGVLRSVFYKELAPKTMLTSTMLNTLINKPQMPQLKMKDEQRMDFNIVDFQDILPVAPGMVLVKAPGHTPGEIMVYIQFENGKEYLLTGDVSWSYKGIEDRLQKPLDQIRRIGEDAPQILFQLEWLNRLPAKGVQLIVSHDDIVQPQLVKKKVLTYGFTLK